jgi:hypothetical protein
MPDIRFGSALYISALIPNITINSIRYYKFTVMAEMINFAPQFLNLERNEQSNNENRKR